MLDARFGGSGGDLVALEDVVVSRNYGAENHHRADGVDDSLQGNNSQPPKLSSTQIAQRRLGLKSFEALADDMGQPEAAPNKENEPSPTRFASSQTKYASLLRSKFGPEWIVDHPLISPVKIIEEAADRPMSAALMCKQACVLLNVGHHARVREYLVAAYSVACGFKSHPARIKDLALELTDGRSSNPMKAELVEQHLLHYVFVYIFHQSGMVKRDRASQYAQSLQYFFEKDAPFSEIDKLLRQYGQNKLRKAAQLRANIMQGAREWVQLGKNPTSVTMEEVLAAMIAEDTKLKSTAPANVLADHGPGDIAPGDLKYKAEVESLSDDADWLLENAPEKNPNATDYELESDMVEEGEDTQLPEVDEFFSEMMRLTAQMVVGLSDDRLDARHREAMMSLVKEVWIKVMRLRGLLA